jgi:predicted flap endonuclease-1-like 5' DNA nuclease
MTKLTKIEGIGEAYAQKLKDIEIFTIEQLLDKGCSPAGRKAIAEATGISERLILEWVNHSDLFRIKGIGEEYADLLEAAGVDAIPELAQRNAANLYNKVIETQSLKKLVRKLPVQSQIENWIEQARLLPRIITY